MSLFFQRGFQIDPGALAKVRGIELQTRPILIPHLKVFDFLPSAQGSYNTLMTRRSCSDCLLQPQPAHESGELLYHAPSGVAVHKVALRPVMLTFAICDQLRRVWLLRMARMQAPGE